ncbi:MAG: SPOR domain-containing protein [Candidatus Omnitrophica bacterium]|nr:SPOR domain-containing protein [Candidatus Omnitrophota bacterium]
MNINYKQTQFELFPGASREAQDAEKPKFFFSSITLTFENIIVLTVLLFMAIIISFSFGVERGKRGVLVKSDISSQSQDILIKSEPLKVPEIPVEENKISVANETQESVVQKVSEPSILKGLPEDFYTVQVASFKTRKYAEKEALILKKKGYEIFIVQKGSHLVVCAGKFLEHDQAEGFSVKLKNKYKDCLVRRL